MDKLPQSPSTSPSPAPPGMRIRPPVIPIGGGSGTPSEFNPNTSSDQSEDVKSRMKNRRPSTPKELISYYESQGMSREEASIRIIGELQKVLHKVVTSGAGKTAPSDVVYSRLMKLESKVDSKPGYGQTLAIGIAAGSVVQGFGHVSSAFAQIWGFVSKAASGKP